MFDAPIYADHCVAQNVQKNFSAYVIAPKYANLQSNNIPKQIQWNENGGYCGESSLSGSGLFFGQYFSQYDLRAAGNDQSSQQIPVLLGTAPELNFDKVAQALSLTYALSNDAGPTVTTNPKDFLAWVKNQVVQGFPVAIGVYENLSWFDPSTVKKDDPSEGYDHIVTITGIGSNYPFKKDGTDIYYDDDVIFIDDHGLWTGETDLNGYTSSTFKDFQKSRKDADADTPTANVYSLPNDYPNYGMATTGVVDTLKETVPLRVDLLPLSASPFQELPEIVDGSSARPTRTNSINLQITASNLEAGVTYNVYRYTDVTQVPSNNFNANSKGIQSFQITSTNPVFTDTIKPNQPPVAIYRAVKTSAP